MKRVLVFILFMFLLNIPLLAVEMRIIERGKIIASLEDVVLNLPRGFYLDSNSTSKNHRHISSPFGGSKMDVAKSAKYVTKNFPFTSIVVIQILQPYEHKKNIASIDAYMHDDHLVTVISRLEKLTGEQGYLLKIKHNAHQTTFVKWAAIFGSKKQTVVVTGSCPERRSPRCSKALRRVVGFAKLRPKK